MPRRDDIEKILIIGSGPIVIGQACEFDYSGTQACKVLRREGYGVVLINSNPATIMTDPDVADATYVEPVTPEYVAKVIEKERPDAVLPTLGGQTALNIAADLARDGTLDRLGTKLIGASLEAIEKAENRKLFREAMERIGIETPRSGFAYSVEDALNIATDTGYPVIIRPSFTLGGTGARMAFSEKELRKFAEIGISESPIGEVLIEESILGWKEFEMEVMRDKADNAIIVCSIENLDPMGVHTGDSITVAPALTLTDEEYQKMRDQSIAVLREIGVETGGSNVQFAVNPRDGRSVVIEMNPRVSRSSALASKATGFPIAKIAALLACGYTLDEIPNDITRKTPACFEPSIDYVVTKVPRFTFEKFRGAKDELGPQMKSVGEVMAIGATFLQSLQKALRGLEIKRFGLGSDGLGQSAIIRDEFPRWDADKQKEYLSWIREKLRVPNCDRIFTIKYAFQLGLSIEEVYDLCRVDRWFLYKIMELVEFEDDLPENLSQEWVRRAKELGYSDRQLSWMLRIPEDTVRAFRKQNGIEPVYKGVDTCAGEFEAYTPYFYSTYDNRGESVGGGNRKFAVIGGGPNRIGQGIEFDYCCVQAARTIRDSGYEVVMINSNPETVSTDYDESDRLYFEPLTLEDVLAVLDREKVDGVILQLGGQTPLNLASGLKENGITVMGTQPEAIDLAENREKFAELLERLGMKQPENGIAFSPEEAVRVAERIGYPVLVRPSYVLGGRAMEIVYSRDDLMRYMSEAVEASPDQPVLVDRFLEDAVEIDVDCICDGKDAVVAGIMEHIERAGIHSGDSACVLPPVDLAPQTIRQIEDQTVRLALEMNVVGLMNVQYACHNGEIFIIEANPRASRTVPFVAKATGFPIVRAAVRVMLGEEIKNTGIPEKLYARPDDFSVKEVVLPFKKFDDVDILLGPEMRSTGEVMGMAPTAGEAFLKAQAGAYAPIPAPPAGVLLTVNDNDKKGIVPVARIFSQKGYRILATRGTGEMLREHGIDVEVVRRLAEGSRGELVEKIQNKEIGLIINTPGGRNTREDAFTLRRAALKENIPVLTTLAAAVACARGLETESRFDVCSLQDREKRFSRKSTTPV